MSLTTDSKEYSTPYLPSDLEKIIIDYLFDDTTHSSQKVYIHDIEEYSVYNQLKFHICKEKITENIYTQKLNNFTKDFYRFDPEDFIVEYKNDNTISIKTNIEYDENIKEQIITTNHNSYILNFLLEKQHNTFVFFEKKLWDSILTPALKKQIIFKNIQNIYYYSSNDSLLYSKYKYDQMNEYDLSYYPPPVIELISNMPVKQQQEVTDINFSISYDYEPETYDLYLSTLTIYE